jgi:hypothetical protein
MTGTAGTSSAITPPRAAATSSARNEVLSARWVTAAGLTQSHTAAAGREHLSGVVQQVAKGESSQTQWSQSARRCTPRDLVGCDPQSFSFSLATTAWLRWTQL